MTIEQILTIADGLFVYLIATSCISGMLALLLLIFLGAVYPETTFLRIRREARQCIPKIFLGILAYYFVFVLPSKLMETCETGVHSEYRQTK